MATLTNLRTRVYSRLGLDSTSSGTDETETTAYLNEAIIDILLQTGIYVTSASTALTAGTADYTLDSSILRIKEAYLTSGGTQYGVTQATPSEILDLRRNSGSGSPIRYYAVESNLLMVYPTPSAADTLTLYYTPVPTALSSASHDSSSTTYGGIPEAFSPAIVAYACWKLGDREDDRTSQNGQMYFTEYQQHWIPKIRKYRNIKGGTTLSPFVLNRSRRKFVSSNPSADY